MGGGWEVADGINNPADIMAFIDAIGRAPVVIRYF